MAMSKPSAPMDDEAGGYAPMAEINMTPFVDVMLVLLVIFMVAAPLMMTGVPLQLPKSAAAKLTPPAEPLVVSIDAEGRVYLGDEPMADGLVLPRLKALAGEDAERTVHVRAERGLTYGRVMEVVGEISAAGFRKVTMVAQDDAAKRGS